MLGKFNWSLKIAEPVTVSLKPYLYAIVEHPIGGFPTLMFVTKDAIIININEKNNDRIKNERTSKMLVSENCGLKAVRTVVK